jgi:hypothetical protein
MLEQMLELRPRAFIKTIEEVLGDRLKYLKRDEDKLQTFWMGVLEAIPRMKIDNAEVNFLISAGYGAIRNWERSKNTERFFKFCPTCGRKYAYRVVSCSHCKNTDLNIDLYDVEEDNHLYSDPDHADLIMTIEQYVQTIDGRKQYVAQRWLIERADLMFANHIKQIAFELGISAPAVAKYKKTIRAEFQEFLRK